jgi:transposase-like protein
MAKRTYTAKKIYDAKFKAEVALMALSELHTADAVAKHFAVHKTQVNSWRNVLKENAAQLFVKGKHELLPDNTDEIDGYKRIIGELTVENSLLKKKLR